MSSKNNKKKRDSGTNLLLDRPSPLFKAISSTAFYALFACILTWPLVAKINSSAYGPYDHFTTDMFATKHIYFWWIEHAILHLRTSPLVTEYLGLGARINFANFTGFVMLPFTALFGYVSGHNLTLLLNIVLSGLGMYYLARYVTGNSRAAFIAGVIYAFWPNMMVRAYTTFDSIQVQWIPLYTLFLLKFLENRTWRNAVLTGLFLSLNIVLTMPIFLVYLPVHTIVVLAGWAVSDLRQGRGISSYSADIFSRNSLHGWLKAGVVLGGVALIFIAYYSTVVGGGDYVASTARDTHELAELSQRPLDYLMPHPRSFLLKGNVRETYWNTRRPGKDPDSFVAYIGYIALALAVAGIVSARKNKFVLIFGAVTIVAFWSTLGPNLLGIPTPSGLIHLYAPFARRILLYKVFVQLGIAVLAAFGVSWILKKVAGRYRSALVLALASVMLLEYAIVPPVLNVDLSHTPELYRRIKELPDDSVLIEVPLRRANGNVYQGYLWYQTIHQKKLFNNFGFTVFPENRRPFFEQMDVPLEAQSYANLAVLRHLGVTHLVYHWYIGTRTVVFRAFSAPGFTMGKIDGLKPLYMSQEDPRTTTFPGPYDYNFGDLYEITAELSPVALIFDYPSPYHPVESTLEMDGITNLGWLSAIIDRNASFYPPLEENGQLIRLLHNEGRINVMNITDKEVEFDIVFSAKSAGNDSGLEIRWNDRQPSTVNIEGDYKRLTVEQLRLGPSEQGVLTLKSDSGLTGYQVKIGDRDTNLPARGVFRDFKTLIKN